MSVHIVYIVIGLVGLFWGGEWLVKGAERLAVSFGISPLVVGLTIVAAGTSAPELIVNVSAALQGSTELALGNVVGSNIANIGLILGIAGLIAPIGVAAILVRREIPLMIAISGAAFLMALDHKIGRFDGIALTIGFILFTVTFIYLETRDKPDEALHDFQELKAELTNGHRLRELGRLLVGTVLLVIGAQAMVKGATAIAEEMGVSQLVIGLTLVAFGTSLPELATSIIASFRKQTDILVGNIIGSNIFNILLVLGTTGFIRNIPVASNSVRFDMPVMLVYSVVLLPVAFDLKLHRWEAAIFLVGYLAFVFLTFSG